MCKQKTRKFHLLPLITTLFSTLNVAEQVIVSLIPEKEKGSTDLQFLNNAVPNLCHI